MSQRAIRRIMLATGALLLVGILVVSLAYIAIQKRQIRRASVANTSEPPTASRVSDLVSKNTTEPIAPPTAIIEQTPSLPQPTTRTPIVAMATPSQMLATPIATRTQSAPQALPALSSGQSVLTRQTDSFDLWTLPEGGERVNERPKLYPGAQVTILNLNPNAVQVRTPEGVEGWIHVSADVSLTADLNGNGMQSRFSKGDRIQIIWSNGIPLRSTPSSHADKVVSDVEPGRQGVVEELLGDWLQVTFDDGATGWVRWYYSGRLFVDALKNIEGLTNLTRLATAVASSTRPAEDLPKPGHVDYEATYAIDGKLETAWVEGDPSGPGIGQWLMLTFPRKVHITRLGLDIGYDSSDKVFNANNRVQLAHLIFSDGSTQSIDFQDSHGLQYQLINPISTTSITIVIDDIYLHDPNGYDDTPIAEVTVWGQEAP